MVETCSPFRIGPRVLVRGSDHGPLAGWRLAVKDVIDVAGERTGAGNPAWLAQARPAERSAAAVDMLVGTGATVVGKTRTDELAFSLAGANPHEGAPPNPVAPRRLAGGSSSGSASAVGLGWADIGLGTDTGGSIRVPASYTGLVGFRPSHGAVPFDGVLPLAPSFDTVGWLTRSGRLAEQVGDVLLPPGTHRPARVLVLPTDILADLEPGLSEATKRGAREVARRAGMDVVERRVLAGASLGDLVTLFWAIQWVEIWATWGSWVSSHSGDLGEPTRSRFEAVRAAVEQGATSTAELQERRRRLIASLRALLGNEEALVVPSAAGPAPLRETPETVLSEIRQATLALGSVAGLLGAPAVSLPVTRVAGLPLGISLVGLPGTDRSLLAIAALAVP
jgi:amidase